MEQENQKEIEKVSDKEVRANKKALMKWKIINILCFVAYFILTQLSVNLWNWFWNLDEYMKGLSGIFLLPIFVILFCYALMGLAMVAIVFVVISMIKIINRCSGDKKIWCIILGIEIILYAIYILTKYRTLIWFLIL